MDSEQIVPFDIKIRIAGAIEHLHIVRDNSVLEHSEYEVFHRGELLARIWPELGDGDMKWCSTDLIAGQVLADIGSAIERHFA